MYFGLVLSVTQLVYLFIQLFIYFQDAMTFTFKDLEIKSSINFVTRLSLRLTEEIPKIVYRKIKIPSWFNPETNIF